MARRGLKPVSIAGIEFDALIEETKTLSATVPVYPVENGFPVSDTIILDPLRIQMTLYVTNTPVTWLYRHGSSKDRVRRICEALESLWLDRRLVKIVTSDTIYTNMGITSLTIKKSRDTGYAREVGLAAQKVRVTDRETTQIPDYILKSGETQANAGTASTSSSSSRTGGGAAGSSGGSQGGDSGDGAGSDSPAKKSQSILFGVASGMDWI
jgi:uncharacterized membrane protein YgcG